MRKLFMIGGTALALAAAVGVTWAATRARRGSPSPQIATPVQPQQGAAVASLDASYDAPAGASRPWREVMDEKKAAAAARTTPQDAGTPADEAAVLPMLDAPVPAGPAGGVLDLTSPAGTSREPVVVAQAPKDQGEDQLRKSDAAIEEDEDKIPLDAAHKGYTPLSFKTLGSYKYEVFIPEEGSKPEDLPAEALKDQIPERIKKLDKKKIAIRGFMVPTIVEVEGVRAFLLTRSRSLCCFGEMPEMNEWIDAELPEGKFTDFHSDVVITVYGTLEVGEQRDGGVVLSLYRMKVEDVVPMPGENVESYYM